jgi:hypothetical protein
VDIRCDKLTTCVVLDDGETVRLDFVDPAGDPVSVMFSFAHAEAIAMTLPSLLTRALATQTGRADARYVFPLGQWLLEGIEDRQSLILTLKTDDGFEVSFRLPLDTCRALGWVLHHEADDAMSASACSAPPGPCGGNGLN